MAVRLRRSSLDSRQRVARTRLPGRCRRNARTANGPRCAKSISTSNSVAPTCVSRPYMRETFTYRTRSGNIVTAKNVKRPRNANPVNRQILIRVAPAVTNEWPKNRYIDGSIRFDGAKNAIPGTNPIITHQPHASWSLAEAGCSIWRHSLCWLMRVLAHAGAADHRLGRLHTVFVAALKYGHSIDARLRIAGGECFQMLLRAARARETVD